MRISLSSFYIKAITTILLTISISGCQQYHDTTARFNAYFLAKEKMMEIETSLFGTPVNDYNDVLDVLVSIDTNKTKSQKANFDYCIQKASLPIQWHKTSKWVDNCYNIIGKTRLYRGDFSNAVSTFKYVNSKSRDRNNKHEALVLLMRTFIESGEYNNLAVTKDYIKKQKSPFNEENTLNYHLTLAHYYRLEENFTMVARHLEIVMPLVKNKLQKSRYHYLLGQVYQLEEKDSMAHRHYTKALKYNPPYELWFHSKLKATGMQDINKKDIIVKAERFYKKMLRDEKNWEYHDRIYYEMAKFQLRREDIDKAIEYLNQSIKSSSTNKVQKAYSYLELGKLHYDIIKDYEVAAAYYDSTAKTMPQTNKNYIAIKERAAVLDSFVTQYSIVRKEDKNQLLATLTPDSLDRFLENEIAMEKEAAIKKREDEIINQKKRKRRIPVTSTLADGDPNASKWYFSNEQSMVKGKSNFLRIWGNRPLEDNWRRSNKELVTIRSNEKEERAEIKNKKGEKQENEEEDLFANIKDKDARMAEIPFDSTALDASNRRLETALFELGKIYFFKLNEQQNAIETFERLFNDFPDYEFTPEAMYILYGYCPKSDKCDYLTYRERLLERYPDSFYANIIKNPNFVAESNIVNKKAEALYVNSFELYKNAKYQLADSTLNIISEKYPKSEILDKVSLLHALIIGKTSENKIDYTNALNDFIKEYDKSELVPYAESLLGKRTKTKNNSSVKPNKKASKDNRVKLQDKKGKKPKVKEEEEE